MKIFTRMDWVKDNPDIPTATALYPYLGIFPEAFHDARAPMSRRFDAYVRLGSKYMVLVGELDCDAFLFPFEWYGVPKSGERSEFLTDFLGLAAEHGKPAIIMAYGDEHVDSRHFPGAIVLQSNLHRTDIQPADRAMPSFVEDLNRGCSAARSAKLSFFRRKGRPSVSFCGFAGSAPQRKAVLDVLLRSTVLEKNFVIKDAYYGGAWEKKLNGFNYNTLASIRKDYVKNLHSSDYVLCVRGYGNYSARFYEALCAGQIPLLIDTDCVFPFESTIDYSEFVVRLREADIDRVPEMLCDIDSRMSDEEFYWRRRRAREVWCNYLSPEGFFRHLGLAVQ